MLSMKQQQPVMTTVMAMVAVVPITMDMIGAQYAFRRMPFVPTVEIAVPATVVTATNASGSRAEIHTTASYACPVTFRPPRSNKAGGRKRGRKIKWVFIDESCCIVTGRNEMEKCTLGNYYFKANITFFFILAGSQLYC